MDEDHRTVRARQRPFSGARPEAGAYALPEAVAAEPLPDGPDHGAAAASGSRVAVLTAAVQSGDRSVVATAWSSAAVDAIAAESAARAALAQRLLPLSGASGPGAFAGEDPAELLRAYAELLATRSEPRRRRLALEVTSEQVQQVARAAAAEAVGLLERGPRLTGARVASAITGSAGRAPARVPAPVALLAAALLLVQTAADGGDDLQGLAEEVRRLFASG